ncbi:MAG: phenylalanine--tRNA ligase subunit alpha [Anaerolineae bacterium]|nr:phenylalanine--tRNA ligase subunit alpha [Anaerolineae bacterium]
MFPELEKVHDDAKSSITAITDAEALQAWETAYLGRKGAITLLLRSVGQLPKDDRAAFGQRANAIRDELEGLFRDRQKAIEDIALARSLEEGEIDVTLPGRTTPTGGIHPATRTLRQIYDIWADMGFQVFRTREVEDDETNFGLLNIPPHHPARDMWDTFHTTTPGVILRTHTSPGQIHAMRRFAPGPIRVILPGMCFRYEQISARKEIQFNQVEGLAVGTNIRLSDLKGTITAFARRMFGAERKVRFRGSYFPFTEPSMEVDVECFCEGKGCSVCKGTGWLEIAGCGMVHPVVLRNGGYDPAVHSGFAFGMGPERITMLKHGITDIRYFWGNDLRFLEQF